MGPKIAQCGRLGTFNSMSPILLRDFRSMTGIRALRSWKIGKAVDSAVLTNPVSGVHMVGVRLLGKPRPSGLLGGEEALLGLGYFMEPSGGLFIRSWHYIFPQLSCGIMRYRCVWAGKRLRVSHCSYKVLQEV